MKFISVLPNLDFNDVVEDLIKWVNRIEPTKSSKDFSIAYDNRVFLVKIEIEEVNHFQNGEYSMVEG